MKILVNFKCQCLYTWHRCRPRHGHAMVKRKLQSQCAGSWSCPLHPLADFAALGKWLNLCKPQSPCSFTVDPTTLQVASRQFSCMPAGLFVSLAWGNCLGQERALLSLWMVWICRSVNVSNDPQPVRDVSCGIKLRPVHTISQRVSHETGPGYEQW